MAKSYKIIKTETLYSKKKGSYSKNFVMEKGIPTIDEAIRISTLNYGNKNGLMKWRSGAGMIFPTEYCIK